MKKKLPMKGDPKPDWLRQHPSDRQQPKVTAEEIQEEMLFEAFEILPPFNVAQKVEHLIEGHGAQAAEQAQFGATFARAYGEPEIAEDYELARKTILERQEKPVISY